MKIIHWLVFLVSAALLATVVMMARGQEPKTPREILGEATEQLSVGATTHQDAIRAIDRAIQVASEEPEAKLLADLHMARGEMYFKMGGYAKAGEDFKRVLGAYRPGDRRAETLLADVDIETRRFESAEERIRGILAKRPRDARAWVQFGRLGRLTAEALVEQSTVQIQDALVPEDAILASQLLKGIAARDPRDPSRVALILELRKYFGDDDGERIRDILDNADEASRAYRQARSATARSLQSNITTESATLLLELFAMAGRDKLVTDLGSLLVADGQLEINEDLTLVMLKSYEKLGQHDLANRLITPWLMKGKAQTIRTEEFYREACNALYRAEAWRSLIPLAGSMRFRLFTKETKRLADLYQGIAYLNSGEFDEKAVYALSRFFSGLEEEIFPNSRAIGYAAKAQAQRNLEDPGEIESLIGVYSFDPGCDGEIHVRLSHLMQAARNRGAAPPLMHMTLAMAKMPKQTTSLMEEWIALGEKEIATSSINMPTVYERLRDNKTWIQAESTSSYRMWLFGESYKEDEEWVGLNATAKRCLSLYPGFLPALDHRIEAELQLGNLENAVELVLERIDRAGIDEQAVVWIQRIPSAGKTNDHVLRLMRADPAHAGRFIAARTMVEDGQLKEALDFLMNSEKSALDDIENRLLAETAMSLGRHKLAERLLATLQEADPDSLEIATLRVSNLSKQDSPEGLITALDALLSHPDVTRETLESAVDELIRSSRYQFALSTLEKIDHRVELRSGGFLLRSGLIQMLLGDYPQAEQSLERSDAFEKAGGPELARVFLSLEARDWRTLSTEAALLYETEAQPSPYGAAALTLFREDLEGAQWLIEEMHTAEENSLGLHLLTAACSDFLGVEDTRDSQLNKKLKRDMRRLLRGTEENPRDPREALGLLLALEDSVWIPWARAEVAKLDAQTVGPLWPLYFGAKILAWQGDLDLALERLGALHLIRPEFVPAWDLHEEILVRKLGTKGRDRVEELRLERAGALVDVEGLTAEAALAAVTRAFTIAGPERALLLSNKLIGGFDYWGPGYANLAKLQSLQHKHSDSLNNWITACLKSEPSSDLSYVADLFEELAAAKRNGQSPEVGEFFVQLEEVALHLPEDPLLTVKLAALDIETELIDPAAGVDRAFARLDRFRAKTEFTLNQLRPGTAKKWVAFIATIDTTKAEELVESELLRRPGDLELWLLRGQVFSAQGNPNRALENCKILLQMSRSTRVLRAMASLLADTGAPFKDVQPLLKEISERDGDKDGDIELLLTRLRSTFNQEDALRANTVNVLRNLWHNRRGSADIIESSQLGLLFIKALLSRGTPEDRLTLRHVAEKLIDEGQLDWYDKPFFKTILGVTAEATAQQRKKMVGQE